MAKYRKENQSFWRLCFVAYCGLMLWLLFGQRWGTEVYAQQLAESINLTPLTTIKRYWHVLQNTKNASMLRHAVINLVGNVVMFIPLGYCLPRIWRRFRSFFPTIMLSVLLIVAVETIQYFTKLGTCDIDDLILNTLGACMGYILFKIKHR